MDGSRSDRTKGARVLERVTDRIRTASRNRRLRLASLLVALPLFGGALVFAWLKADIDPSALSGLPLLGVVAAVPLTVLASAWQLRAVTGAAGVDVPWFSAIRVVTLGTLSGLLPVTSGTVVRAGAVVYWGVRPRLAARFLAFDALVWLTASLFYGGSSALAAGARPAGVAMLIGGAILVPVTIFVAGREMTWDRTLRIAAARIAGILVEVLRLLGCFFTLGYAVHFAQVSALAAASPLASLLFFLPAGLGVREGFTSAVGASVGLSAAGAFLAAALNRLVGLTVVLVGEMGLLGTSLGKTKEKAP